MILPNAVIITAAGYSRRFNNSENFTGKKEFVKLEKDMIASGTDLKGYYQALINTVKQQDLKPQNEKQD